MKLQARRKIEIYKGKGLLVDSHTEAIPVNLWQFWIQLIQELIWILNFSSISTFSSIWAPHPACDVVAMSQLGLI